MEPNRALAAVDATQWHARPPASMPADAPRSIAPADWRRYEGCVSEMLEALGLAPDTLVEGLEPLRDGLLQTEPLSVRRHDGHLFLRYRLAPPGAATAPARR